MPHRTASTQITMSAPDIDDDDIQAVVSVLRSGQLALGPRVEQFERTIAEGEAEAKNDARFGIAQLRCAWERLGG